MAQATLKTIIHTYSVDEKAPGGHDKYRKLREQLQADGRHFFNVHRSDNDNRFPFQDGDTIELETNFLFDNQWNSADTPERKGWRVFDWYEGIVPNRSLHIGHWLEITDEMREIRASTLKCGYCGKHYPDMKGKTGFCSSCLGSEYLKEDELKLLRLEPVAIWRREFPELTAEEKAELMPMYIEAQTKGTAERYKTARAKEREDIEREFREWEEKVKQDREKHQVKYRGYVWLWEHEINTNNVIYYDHTGKFCFGWRSPLDPAVKSRMLDLLSEFPYDYEFEDEKRKS
jgi:hypothetical protein